MKKLLYYLTAIVVSGVMCFVYIDTSIAASASGAETDKGDGTCTGLETEGRCADKCANPGDTLQGFDKETGAAICRSAPTGCPYGDSVPLGPECDRLAPMSTDQSANVNSYVNPDPSFGGK